MTGASRAREAVARTKNEGIRKIRDELVYLAKKESPLECQKNS